MSSKVTFKKHRPVDRTDPGFSIPGRKLRWISALGNENAFSRIWMALTKEDLAKESPELVKDLEKRMPGVFSRGNTIRRGDLVLAYADLDAVIEVRNEIAEKTAFQERHIRSRPDGFTMTGNHKVGVEYEEERIQISAEDFKK